MGINTPVKDPDESKLYTVDFSDVLATGETLLGTPTVTPNPSGLTITAATITDSVVQFRAAGGTSGTFYAIDVIIGTSTSSTLNASVNLVVQDAAWFDELIIMLRLMIGDTDDDNLSYTDQRLAQLLTLAAQYVVTDLQLNSQYSVNVRKLMLVPDPSADDTRNPDLMNMIVLKAACIADQSTYRTKAAAEGVRVSCGPANISVSGNLKGYQYLLDKGACKAYEEAMTQYLFGDASFCRAILSPFVSNSFDPRSIVGYRVGGNYRGRSGMLG